MIRTRFAPSPNGLLHLGHAYAAVVAHDLARARGGEFLLRIEDIDGTRSRAELIPEILADLDWLGLRRDGPVVHQSSRLPSYQAAAERLKAMGLLYPCRCTRAEVLAASPGMGQDGPIYPGTCRGRSMAQAGPDDALRLDIRRAVQGLGGVSFTETGPAHAGTHHINADDLIHGTGDIILARRDIATSYHLAVVVDDAAQGVTHVIRGADLFAAVPVQALLQRLLGYPHPSWHHHRLIRDQAGRRLAKRDDDRAIATYRAEGATPEAIRQMVGLSP